MQFRRFFALLHDSLIITYRLRGNFFLAAGTCRQKQQGGATEEGRKAWSATADGIGLFNFVTHAYVAFFLVGETKEKQRIFQILAVFK